MYLIMVFHIHTAVANQGEKNPQELSRYGNQCFHLKHASTQHLLIGFVHNSFGFHGVNGSEKQKFPHQGTTPFRDTTLALVLTRTDFVKIKAGQFRDLGDGIKFSKITHFTDQSSCRDDANARIFPFKVHEGKQPYDKVNKTLLIPKLIGKKGTGAYWAEYDWKKALDKGMQAACLSFIGEYDFDDFMRLSELS